jgi:cytochrome c biogenesis protein CcmG/thiol:disulfide interchange protein DsbE
MNRFLAAGVLSVALLLTSCTAPKRETASTGTAKKGKPAPDFVLKDVNGQTVKLSDFKGKVVLLNFWATWCGPCKIEIPWFMDFEQKLKDKGFAVIGVSMDDEGWEVVKPYVEAKKLNYRVVIGDEKLSTAYGGVESLPTTFLVDRTGNVTATHIGLVSKSEYQNEIESLLASR